MCIIDVDLIVQCEFFLSNPNPFLSFFKPTLKMWYCQILAVNTERISNKKNHDFIQKKNYTTNKIHDPPNGFIILYMLRMYDSENCYTFYHFLIYSELFTMCSDSIERLAPR